MSQVLSVDVYKQSLQNSGMLKVKAIVTIEANDLSSHEHDRPNLG